MGGAMVAVFIVILLIGLLSIPILIVLWTIFTEVAGMDRKATLPPAPTDVVAAEAAQTEAAQTEAAQTEAAQTEAAQTEAAQTSANPRSALVGCFALPCVIAGAWSGGWFSQTFSGMVGGAFGGFLLFCLVGRWFSRFYRKLN